MPYLLDLAYLTLLVLASPWLAFRVIRHGKYREGLAAKLLGSVPRRVGREPCIWLHAVSVGEVNVLAPLLACLERDHPGWSCVISTTTRTGFELARRKYAPRQVVYCPLDFSWAVRRALRRLRPDLLVLAELELWPNLVRAAADRGVPVAVVNARLSERSFSGYRWIRPVVADLLSRVEVIAAQNEEYAARFRQLGAPPERVQVTGSIKFDGAETERQNPRTRQLAELAGIRDDDAVFLAGSTQAPEETFALAAFRSVAAEHPRLRLILTPRHPERFDEVAQLLARSGVDFQRRSQLANEGARESARVLLVDAVGELGAWWGTAAVAFVGGSMGTRGGQNMIEPSAYGAAVCFGPRTANFRDVVSLLLRNDAARVVSDERELEQFLRRCLDDPEWARSLGQRARRLVLAQRGAAERTWELIARQIPLAQPLAHRWVA